MRQSVDMKTATVREVQHHFSKVLAWVENGEEVHVTSRNKTVARLVPNDSVGTTHLPLPDFAARARAIWGSNPGSLSKAILDEREERI